MTVVDVVVPVRNEERALPVFVAEVDKLELPDGVELNLLFVEDSSSDETLAVLRRLSEERSNVGFVKLAKSYGQGPAIFFGVRHSKGDAIVMMDADGSHPVSAIPDLVRIHLGGADIVQCIRKGVPNRNLFRRLGSRLFPFVAQVLTGVDLAEQNCYFRLVSRRAAYFVVDRQRYWKSARFPLPPAADFRVAKFDVDTVERNSGDSKYHFWRLISFAIDVLFSLISWPRIAALLTFGTAVAVGLWFLFPVLSIVVVLFLGAALWRFWGVSHHSAENEIAVLETGGSMKT